MGVEHRRQAPQTTHGPGERGGGRRVARALGGSRERLRCAVGRGAVDCAARHQWHRDASQAKHGDASEGKGDAPHEPHWPQAPYAADALARLVREAVRRIAGDLLREGALSYDAHAKLLATSAHAFRHTFGTRAVARDMPIDVVQRILGHASSQTTSIYVHAERQRMLDAATQYYSEDSG